MLRWRRKKICSYNWITRGVIVLRLTVRISEPGISRSKPNHFFPPPPPPRFLSYSNRAIRCVKEVRKCLKKLRGKLGQHFCFQSLETRLKNVTESQDGWYMFSLESEIKRLRVRINVMCAEFMVVNSVLIARSAPNYGVYLMSTKMARSMNRSQSWWRCQLHTRIVN